MYFFFLSFFSLCHSHLITNWQGNVEILGPGDYVTVPAGISHGLNNPGRGEVLLRVRYEPALKNMKSFFHTLAVLSQQGLSLSLSPSPLSPLSLLPRSNFPLSFSFISHPYSHSPPHVTLRTSELAGITRRPKSLLYRSHLGEIPWFDVFLVAPAFLATRGHSLWCPYLIWIGLLVACLVCQGSCVIDRKKRRRESDRQKRTSTD